MGSRVYVPEGGAGSRGHTKTGLLGAKSPPGGGTGKGDRF